MDKLSRYCLKKELLGRPYKELKIRGDYVATSTLKARNREDLRGSTLRKLRNEGDIPAVIYGGGMSNKAVAVESTEFIKTLRQSGVNGIISLETPDGKFEVMTHDMQVDPLKGNVLHVDFFKVDLTSKMDVDVPVHLTGECLGVKDGGIVQQPLYELSVRSLPGDIPETIEVNISDLMIGDSLQVRDLTTTGKYEINNEPEEVIVSILAPSLNNEPDEQQEAEDKQEVVEQEAAEE